MYTQAEAQKCIIHQIRNSLCYVAWKGRKPIAKDLRLIYEAAKRMDPATQRLPYDILTIDDFFEDRLGKYA